MPPAGRARRPLGSPLPLLDRELYRLPDRYRIPIVLCELEGKTHKEAARQLGWPVGTVSGRLSRGRAELARRMKRHGVAPRGRRRPSCRRAAASAVEAATAFAAGSAAVAVSAKVVALAEGTVKTIPAEGQAGPDGPGPGEARRQLPEVDGGVDGGGPEGDPGEGGAGRGSAAATAGAGRRQGLTLLR